MKFDLEVSKSGRFARCHGFRIMDVDHGRAQRVVSSVAFVFGAVGDCETPQEPLSTGKDWEMMSYDCSPQPQPLPE